VINTVYAELPIDQITYSSIGDDSVDEEKVFRDLLEKSIRKNGIRDPIFILKAPETQMKLYVTSGNSRTNIAKKLNIKNIPCIITQWDAEHSKIKGKILNSDKEIKNLYYFPDTVIIKRHQDGWVTGVQPQTGGKKFVDSFYERY
jgi:ParB-like chromosome segregation protein Spo0J